MLSKKQRVELRKRGFTDVEIGALNENLRDRPHPIDLTEPAWQSVLAMREMWVIIQKQAGIEPGEIRNVINQWHFASEKKNPIWGLLRVEYARIHRGQISDFRAAYAGAEKAKMDELYNRGYGRRSAGKTRMR